MLRVNTFYQIFSPYTFSKTEKHFICPKISIIPLTTRNVIDQANKLIRFQLQSWYHSSEVHGLNNF